MKRIKKFIVFFLLLISFATLDIPVVSNEIGIVNVEAASKIKLNKAKATLIKGQTLTLKVSGTKKKVKWSSSNKKVAVVNSKGKVTAKRKGSTIIIARVKNKTLKCKVTVETPSLSKQKISIKTGKTYTLKIKGTKQKVSWSSSNKKIATVNSKGVVRGKSAGKCTITGKIGNKKYACKVTVTGSKPEQSEVTRIEIPYSLVLLENETKQIDAELYPSNAVGKITWKSEDETIATVDQSGKVKGISVGQTTVTAICNGKIASCTVTVQFSEEKAINNIKYESYIVENESDGGVIVIAQNNNKCAINIDVGCIYYDEKGNVIGNQTTLLGENYCLEPGKRSYFYVKGPYKPIRYDVYFDVKQSYYTGKIDAIEITSSKLTSNCVVANVKNNSSINSYTELACIFYKDGVPIGYDSMYAYVEYAGAEDEVHLYYPINSNGKRIIPDSYEINIQYSY